jgi:hypothetical protein
MISRNDKVKYSIYTQLVSANSSVDSSITFFQDRLKQARKEVLYEHLSAWCFKAKCKS